MAGVTGVLVLQGAVGGEAATGPGGGTPRPVVAEARTEPIAVSPDGRSATMKEEGTKPFSMLGVTWTDPSARVAGTVEVRTRAAGSGRWSSWLQLDGDSGQGEDGAARGGTEPAWVGASDGVEVRMRTGGTTSAKLPAGLRLDMVDPKTGSVSGMAPAAFAVEETATPTPAETTPAPAESESGPGPEPEVSVTPTEEAPVTTPPVSETPTEPPVTSAPPSPTAPAPSTPPASPSPSASTSAIPTVSLPPAPPSTMPRPPVTSRAGWGADESISPEAPGYLPGGKVKAVVVHHTAASNTYTCAEAPAVVRGIYAYHVKQLGWKDIGYNFLVDKCGTVYEGRKGGVDRPVLGAHAYGFNTETTGISVLGTYTDVSPSQAALTSIARVAAWKLGQYGVDPAATTTLTAGAGGQSYSGRTWVKGAQVSFPVIHGHRDGYNTQCPGNTLYGKLPVLRSWAGGPVAGLAVKSVTGASLSGTTYYTKSSLTVNWTATTPATLVKQYDLLVDGKVAATTTATSAQATLAPGTHAVQVRAVHRSGRTNATAPLTVVAETTAPVFATRPALALRAGTVNTAAVPVTLSWKATDNASLRDVRLTSPVAATYGPTVYSAAHAAKSAVATNWSLTAHDRAGNTATAAVAGTPVILQETSAVRSGTWTAKSSTSYLGGKSLSSSAKNAALTWTFTGRSAAWVVSRATTSGQAHVYVDGVKAATVDLKSATTKYRDAIWTKTWAAGGKHTVKIVVVGTAGRPAVTTDGLVYLK
ncbi:peptidoglycan recognition protein family protein [Streptomyces sudanensis]|uniref:peptidoglycan recognition protein family protein n=1 Tax=Streptomyces sudanensis TaxID=436397 RepID=UPI003557F7B1